MLCMTFIDLSMFFYYCWIFKHFSSIYDRRVQTCPLDSPQAMRWKTRHAHPGGVVEYQRRLDALTAEDVIWTSYTEHMVHFPFDDFSLFSSHMWWETIVARHLLERCLRQY